MKVEWIQLIPSAGYGSAGVVAKGQRVSSAEDSLQHRRNGNQMRKDADDTPQSPSDQDQHQQGAQADDPHESNAGANTPLHALDITA